MTVALSRDLSGGEVRSSRPQLRPGSGGEAGQGNAADDFALALEEVAAEPVPVQVQVPVPVQVPVQVQLPVPVQVPVVADGPLQPTPAAAPDPVPTAPQLVPNLDGLICGSAAPSPGPLFIGAANNSTPVQEHPPLPFQPEPAVSPDLTGTLPVPPLPAATVTSAGPGHTPFASPENWRASPDFATAAASVGPADPAVVGLTDSARITTDAWHPHRNIAATPAPATGTLRATQPPFNGGGTRLIAPAGRQGETPSAAIAVPDRAPSVPTPPRATFIGTEGSARIADRQAAAGPALIDAGRVTGNPIHHDPRIPTERSQPGIVAGLAAKQGGQIPAAPQTPATIRHTPQIGPAPHLDPALPRTPVPLPATASGVLGKASLPPAGAAAGAPGNVGAISLKSIAMGAPQSENATSRPASGRSRDPDQQPELRPDLRPNLQPKLRGAAVSLPASPPPPAEWANAEQPASAVMPTVVYRGDIAIRAQDTALPQPPPGRAIASHIAAQIAHVAQTAPTGTTDITLNPKELGHLRLSLHSVDSTIAVMITADRPETIDLMRRHIDTLAQEFRGLGYQDISFSFGERQGGAADRQPQNMPANQPADRTARPHEARSEGASDAPADRYLPRRAAAQKTSGALDLRL